MTNVPRRVYNSVPVSSMPDDFEKALTHATDSPQENFTCKNDLLNYNLSTLPAEIRMIIYLQNWHGFRISECLNIKQKNYYGNGKLLINGSKGSGSREVFLPVCFRNLFLDAQNDEDYIVKQTYKQIYNLYKKLGFVCKGKKNAHNERVTHSFRTKFIREIFTHTGCATTVRDCVGHRSIKSQSHYLEG